MNQNENKKTNKPLKVFGIGIDHMYRCQHYSSPRDVLAIKFKCCNRTYGCYHCHEAEEDHKIERWKKSEFKKKVLLCGHCNQWMSINEYIYSKQKCFHCLQPLNPGCSRHWGLYFELGTPKELSEV